MTEAGAGRSRRAPQIIGAGDAHARPTQRIVGGMRNFYEQWLKVLDLPDEQGQEPRHQHRLRHALHAGRADEPARVVRRAGRRRAVGHGRQRQDAAHGHRRLRRRQHRHDLRRDRRHGHDAAEDHGQPGAARRHHDAPGASCRSSRRRRRATRSSAACSSGTSSCASRCRTRRPTCRRSCRPTPGESLRQDFETLDVGRDGLPAAATAGSIPSGFLFEHYDTIGHYRTIDDNGQPVNSAATIVGTGDPMLDVATTDAVQFAGHLGARRRRGRDVHGDPALPLRRRTATRRAATPRRSTTLTDTFNTSGRSIKALLAALTQSEAFLNRLNVQ